MIALKIALIYAFVIAKSLFVALNQNFPAHFPKSQGGGGDFSKMPFFLIDFFMLFCFIGKAWKNMESWSN